MAFRQAIPGEVRGPWDSSPGNPYPYQAAFYTEKGWMYSFSKASGEDALRKAKQAAQEYFAKPEEA